MAALSPRSSELLTAVLIGGKDKGRLLQRRHYPSCRQRFLPCNQRETANISKAFAS